jgi:hypothetical protein
MFLSLSVQQLKRFDLRFDPVDGVDGVDTVDDVDTPKIDAEKRAFETMRSIYRALRRRVN